jgi:hypothetical protein
MPMRVWLETSVSTIGCSLHGFMSTWPIPPLTVGLSRIPCRLRLADGSFALADNRPRAAILRPRGDDKSSRLAYRCDRRGGTSLSKRIDRWARGVLVGAIILGTSKEAAAVDIGKPGEPGSAQVHGFVSPGFILTTSNNYLARSKKGSFEFTEVGLNLTVPITDKLRTGIQLFSRDLGPIGNYSLKADWFYLDYRFEDWLGFRAGRVKIPFGLYNEVNDVDAARVPVLLPQSIYSLANRDFLLAQTGVEIYGRSSLGKLGAFEHRHYAGTIFLDTGEQSSLSTRLTGVQVPFLAGQRLMWETPLEGLRVGGSMQALKLDAQGVIQGKPITLSLPVFLWVASVEYTHRDLLLAAEYGRQNAGLTASDSSLVPPQARRIDSERGYVMASYRMGKVFHPGAYYSIAYPDIRTRNGPAASQHDVAMTFRFDINSWWLVKLEGHFMSGTAGLTSQLNDGEPLDALERRWGVFLAKTTAYF